MILEPTHDLIGALVWRKHWIEEVLYSPASDDQCQALHEPHPVHFKCRQAQLIAQLELIIAQDIEREVEPAGHLTLIFGRLSAHAEHIGLEPRQVLMMIPEAARLGSAPSRPWD
jgi:hypothetical protein